MLEATVSQAISEGESIFVQQETIFVLLLLIITGVALVVRRVKLPYTVALVLVGLVLVLLPTEEIAGLPLALTGGLTGESRDEFTSELILALLVPPLVFEAALQLSWQKLKRMWLPIFLMAVPGVLIATAIVGELISVQLEIPLAIAVAFGALISATDPVAVIAFFRSLGVDKRLSVLMEGESLLNDGVAVVLFGLTVAVASTPGAAFNPLQGLVEFIRVAGGGVVVGLATGALVAQVLARVDDHLIETILTMTLAVGTFVLAEQLEVSGILAVVSAGIVIGSISLRQVSPTTRITLENFWEMLAFIANSAIFLLLGLLIDIGDLLENLPLIVSAVIAILVSRAVVVYSMGWLSTRLGYPVPLKYRHIMFWGGLRGAVALALALSLHGDYASQVQLMTFGVVVFTLLVQGLTIEPLIKRLRLANMVRNEGEQTHLARLEMLRASRRELDNLRGGGLIAEPTWRVLTEMTEDDVQTILHEHPDLERTVLIEARREMLKAKRTALGEALQRGVISDGVYHKELHDLDRRLLIWDQLEESFEQPPPSPSSGNAGAQGAAP